jgi:hypothetical protein
MFHEKSSISRESETDAHPSGARLGAVAAFGTPAHSVENASEREGMDAGACRRFSMTGLDHRPTAAFRPEPREAPSMYLIRDVFQCKPGKAKQLAEKLRATFASTEEHDGFRNSRILVDVVARYWTVVWEAEIESLEQFERHMAGYGARPEVQEAMAGYLDLVDGGHREIFRIL